MNEPVHSYEPGSPERAELKAGRKRTHWMWFVFPQLRGLGHSSMATFYGIASLHEARAYLGPLMRGEDPPPYKDGLPQYVRLKNVAVPKKLGTEFKV